MKRLLLGIFLVAITITLGNNANAQSFSFERIGPEFRQIPYIKDSIQAVQIQAIVRNNTSNTINMKFHRRVNTLPVGWETQMCYDLCYAPFVDTIAPYPLPPYELAGNSVDTFFYIDFLGEDEGIGTSIVRMFNTDNPAEYVEQTFIVQIGDGVGIHTISSSAERFELKQNYPNPFNPATKIRFSIPQNDFVTLKVYNMIGEEISTLVNQQLSMGSYEVEFNTWNNNINSNPSGVYFYRITTSQNTEVRKMIYIK